MLPERLRLPEFEIESGPEADREAAIVLISSTLLLLVFSYWGRPGFYTSSGLLEWVPDTFGGVFSRLPDVGGYLWWGLTSLVLRTLIPFLIVVFLIRRRPIEYGLRFRGIGRHLPIYGAMYVVMLPLLVWMSGSNSFQETYPFYERAGEGGAAYWLYTLGYGLQFVGVEAFFRGFMTFGLLRRFGAFSILIMTIPYVMIHFTKPMPEATAAIFAGLILGYMAVKSKSFVPGILLHVAVAVTMDALVLWRTGVF